MKKQGKIIDQFKEFKVIVIGDAILDTYIKGTTERVCREAPAPVIAVQEEEHNCGGAANTAINVAALGAQTYFLTVIGKDHDGKVLMKALSSHGVNTNGIIRDNARKTLAKKRVTASANILLRFDEGDTGEVRSSTQLKLCEQLRIWATDADAIILSDYGYGIITSALIETVQTIRKNRDLVLIVDSRDLKKFSTLSPTAVKPNYEEMVQLLNLSKLSGSKRVAQVKKKGNELLERTGARFVMATLDADGILVFEADQKEQHITCTPHDNKNAIGAGDTFIGALTLALCANAEAKTAADIASAAASIVIQKEDTAICSAVELKSYFSGDPKYIMSLDDLAKKVEEMRKANKKVVFTNGCFDILHPGHISLLSRANALGDVLIVGLNTDRSIRKIKGKDRPINTLKDRIAVLASLQSIDYLIAFDEDYPKSILKVLQPDIYVKGKTYTSDELPEATLVKKMGGDVKLLPLRYSFSTTQLIEKIREPSSRKVQQRYSQSTYYRANGLR